MTVTAVREPSTAARFGIGFLLAITGNVAVALCAFAIAMHWNARGGEEWSVGLVVTSVVLTVLIGAVALVQGSTRPLGAGIVVGAVLAPFATGAAFIWYFAILHGS